MLLLVMSRDIDQNHLDSTRERSIYERNLRKTFVSKAFRSEKEQEDWQNTEEVTSEFKETLAVIRGGTNTELRGSNYSFQ